jgi:hypothetical protein
MADSTKIWNFERWLPQTSTQLLTIGKYFMDVLGYDSWAFGKVYHDAENYGKEELGQLWYVPRFVRAAAAVASPAAACQVPQRALVASEHAAGQERGRAV